MVLENKFIDLDFAPIRDMIYNGFCIKHSKQILILINYNNRTRQFDGFSVFRTKEISKYRYWSKTEIKSIKKDNRFEYENLLNLNKIKSYYSCLKQLGKNNLIAIFTQNIEAEYFVGIPINISRKAIKLKLIKENSEWSKTISISISEIDFFGFLTKYEKTLLKKVNCIT